MNSTNTFDLSGKIALVTGASRGIGESIAKMLAAHGAHVIVSSRKLEGCERVVDAILSAGGSAEALACNIGDVTQIETMFAAIKLKHRRLDVLVNNAAANPYYGNIIDTDVSSFQKTLDVNIRGYFYSSIHGIEMMTGGGSIVNVSSVNAIIPGEMQGIYSITKAAIVSMTQAFAKECAKQGVRVNALLPGATDTKFASTLVQNQEVLSKLLDHVPMRRVANPDEMAGAVLYLASNAASYTTGVCLNVDGGYLIA